MAAGGGEARRGIDDPFARDRRRAAQRDPRAVQPLPGAQRAARGLAGKARTDDHRGDARLGPVDPPGGIGREGETAQRRQVAFVLFVQRQAWGWIGSGFFRAGALERLDPPDERADRGFLVRVGRALVVGRRGHESALGGRCIVFGRGRRRRLRRASLRPRLVRPRLVRHRLVRRRGPGKGQAAIVDAQPLEQVDRAGRQVAP